MKKYTPNIALYPLSILYGIVTGLRNWLYDKEVIPSKSFKIPLVVVGNLSVGGTGKTPHTEFILSLLQPEWKTAMLSRGYKRQTKGFVLADEKANNHSIGDEPFQIFQKFPNVLVAVDEKRVRGVENLQKIAPDLQVVVLDDAMQHRAIRAGMTILLTEYANLYTADWLMPTGRLREWKINSKRADVIVVTKCPAELKPIEMRIVESELKPETNQAIFFSTYVYDDIYPVFSEINTDKRKLKDFDKSKMEVLLVAGIVSPEDITEYLNDLQIKVESLFFPDHYNFQPKDFNSIKYQFEHLISNDKIILVTEKDAARIIGNPDYPETLKAVTYALPIRVKILQNKEKQFIQKIKNYVVENSRNR